MPEDIAMPRDVTTYVKKEESLPIVVKLREDGTNSYFLITDTQTFIGKVRASTPPGELMLDYANMKHLATKHGKKMTEEEFERGKVVPSFFMTGNENDGYSQYRFEPDEKKPK